MVAMTLEEEDMKVAEQEGVAKSSVVNEANSAKLFID